MDQLLAGKTALVTGGGVGIGKAIAQLFAREGARIAITYRTHEPDPQFFEDVTRSTGREPLALAADATDPAQVSDAIAAVEDGLGGLDVLVNNVGGLVQRATLGELTLELWQSILRVNLDSTFLFSQGALPLLRRGSGGRIVNVASLAGHTGGHPGALAYATSKAALFGFTRALATELAPDGITVNSLAPGFIEATPFHDTFTTAESKARTVAGIPLGRAGAPEDVAGAALWLASRYAGYVTGTVTDVNGGQYLR
ncbi:SDR family NAD(P)-dependent oxidoreductase [Amycolatopsis benzoatilytica]|uniref:SDR family NAD(P)-dependent oxidoreductase n=1 Tax=Amycolatopsis benzoatilytica TaxID=346045 RepID=UPI000376571B|nr:SDR family NAD(P)-dependent oxidoreductase [Amycolatopsis benzoatilytica]